MIEIFTKASGGTAERSLSTSVTLSTPSDVYFGTTSAGIAFYEKAGADLRVTLLDGKVLTLRNFFAVGPNGEFSRLLPAEGAEPEVTGLIAPEPFVPRDEAPVLTSAPVAETQPQIAPSATAAPASDAIESDVLVQPAGDVIVDGGGGFFGIPLDLMAFGGANLGLLWAGLSSDDDSDDSLLDPAPEDAISAELGEDLALLIGDPGAGEAEDLLLSGLIGDAEAPTLADEAAIIGVEAPVEEILFTVDAAPSAVFDELPYSASVL